MRKLAMAAIAALSIGCGGGGADSQAAEPVKLPGVIAFVHGGGWVSAPTGTPQNAVGLVDMARGMGFAYSELKYPLASDSAYSWPKAHTEIRQQLENLSRSYERVYVVGTSSGANLVALALLENPSAATRAALFYGVYDLPAMDASFNGAYSNKYTPDLYEASPAHIGQIETPHRLWHGVDDELVPYSQSVNYDAEHTELVDGGHGFNVATDYLRRFFSE